MHIFIYDNQCFNVDNEADAARLLEQGARELTAEETASYGMAGFEQYVSPANTTVNADGTVTFTPPQPPAAEELFASLRAERDRRLQGTDYLLMPDYPISETARESVKAYRQALRDLPEQEGAPWDGGGSETPWPVKPEV